MKSFSNILKVFFQNAFRKQQIEYKNALTEFSRSLTLIVDLEQLKANVISKIREIAQVKTILFYFLNPDLNRFVLTESRGLENSHNSNYYFSSEGPFVRWFAVNETSLIISENPNIFSFFSLKEQEIIQTTAIDFVFPLIAMNRITGLVCLGKKSSKSEFTSEEIELLTTLLGQASLAFENAFLYQQQKTRLKRMYRADRLATLGQLAAGAAHEIRNPLTSIRSTIQYLQKDIVQPEKKQLVVELIEEVDRINGIIEGLLSFSKPSKPQIEEVNLLHLLEQTLALVTTSARKQDVQIDLKFNSGEQILKADPAQMKQAFLNIIMNALQASNEHSQIEITVEQNQKSEALTGKTKTIFYITIKDCGCGIGKSDLEHVFDPFFTTKKDGTGLGLSITYGIIQQHGGDIEVESVTTEENPEQHGTKVIIVLPEGA